jgi:hypothetical protein
MVMVAETKTEGGSGGRRQRIHPHVSLPNSERPRAGDDVAVMCPAGGGAGASAFLRQQQQQQQHKGDATTTMMVAAGGGGGRQHDDIVTAALSGSCSGADTSRHNGPER